MTQENQTNRRLSPRELFGEEGVLLEAKGVEHLVCVAENIDSVKRFAEAKGFLLDQTIDEDYIKEYVMYREEQISDGVVSFVVSLEKGPLVWVTNIHTERFPEILKDLQTYLKENSSGSGT